MRIPAAVMGCVLIYSGVAAAQGYKGPPWFSASRCSAKYTDEPEKAVDYLKDWAALYRAFRLYGICDDGGVAEGFSDAVAKLLANQWQTLPELAKLARSDRQFEQFVFRHLDETVNQEDDLAIVGNAQNRCPNGLAALCRRLVAKAKPSN